LEEFVTTGNILLNFKGDTSDAVQPTRSEDEIKKVALDLKKRIIGVFPLILF
jgi:hypothetical protein